MKRFNQKEIGVYCYLFKPNEKKENEESEQSISLSEIVLDEILFFVRMSVICFVEAVEIVK